MDDNLLGKRDYIKAKNHCILPLTYGDTFILYKFSLHNYNTVYTSIYLFIYFFFARSQKF